MNTTSFCAVGVIGFLFVVGCGESRNEVAVSPFLENVFAPVEMGCRRVLPRAIWSCSMTEKSVIADASS